MSVTLKTFAEEENPDSPFYILMIGTSHCAQDYCINHPSTPFYRVEYILSGSGCVNENGRSAIVKKGDTYLLHAGADHFYYSVSKEPWQKIWMNFGGTVVDSLVDAYGLRNHFYFPNTNIRNYMEDIHHISTTLENKVKIFDHCASVFFNICQYLHHAVCTPPNASPTTAQQLMNILNNLSDYTVSFDDIIEQLHCTKSHAIRSFNAAYHTTPYDYLLAKKISVAQNLLLYTDFTITAIAEQIGFCDSHYFSNYFKKRVGVSPTQFRNGNNI